MSGFTNIHDKAINRVVDVNCHILPILDMPPQQKNGQTIADLTLNQAAKRSRTEGRIIAHTR